MPRWIGNWVMILLTLHGWFFWAAWIWEGADGTAPYDRGLWWDTYGAAAFNAISSLPTGCAVCKHACCNHVVCPSQAAICLLVHCLGLLAQRFGLPLCHMFVATTLRQARKVLLSGMFASFMSH